MPAPAPHPQARLTTAWRAYWEGNHLALIPALNHLQAQLNQAEPQLRVEYWLLRAHLFAINQALPNAARAYQEALAAALAQSDPLLPLAVHLTALEHQILTRQYPAATSTLAATPALAAAMAADYQPAAQALLGRLAFLTALLVARTQGRHAALPYLVNADRHARVLGQEVAVFGIAFGPLNLKTDCTFLFLCFDDPRGALRLSQSLDSTPLTPLRQAFFLLDIALAYAALGNRENEEYYYSKAARLIPHFRPYSYI